MLSREDNELLTRVGHGTRWAPRCAATGSRRCWRASCQPGLPSGAGEAAGRGPRGVSRHAGPDRPGRRALSAPRLALLRPQRGLRAALRLPRLEVRRDGRCVDMMNEPETTQFKDKRSPSRPIHAGARRHDLGLPRPRGAAPAPPRFAWTQVPVTHRQVSKVIQETNWLQGLEGGVHVRTRPSCTASSRPTPPGPASSRRTRSCAARRR